MLTIFILIIGIYLIISLFLIFQQEHSVKKSRDAMFDVCSKRFAVFEDLISKLKNKKDYESTFINEVVNYRINIQKNKKQKNFKVIFQLEDKITKISNNIVQLLKEFPQFHFLTEQQEQELEEKLQELNNQLKDLRKEYTFQVEKFNIIKSNPIFILALIYSLQNNKKYDFWS